jgi:hypothetical protein
VAWKLSEEQRRRLSKLIEEAANANHWTKKKLAEKAGYDERTIRNVLACHAAKYETYANICSAVGLDIGKLVSGSGPPGDARQGIAAEDLGGYTRKMHELYVGQYVTIRPKYADPTIIKSYVTEIWWDEASNCYCFEEKDRIDPEYAHRGYLYIPIGTSCLYLMTIHRGWVRTVIVSQLGKGRKVMRGLITSEYNMAGAAFAPVSAPIALLKMSANTEVSLGELTKADRLYDTYLRILQETIQKSFAHIALPPLPAASLNVVSLSSRQGS